MFITLTMGPNPMNFNLRNGGTINITAFNETGARKNFRYMVKDKKLGYPVAENFDNEVSGAVLYVPANRNYSIMIFPNQSFPVSYDLDNLTTSNNYINVTFNTSTTLRRVTGNVNLSDGSDNFSDLKIIAYLMEPGNMISQDHPLPYNMSAMKCPFGPPSCQSDIYDPATGNYNISLPGAVMNAKLLLFATTYNSTSGNYSGSFRTITLGYSNSPVTGFNFSLQQLLGTQAIITLNNASIMGPPGLMNITTRKLSFQLQNSTGANITGSAHVEVKVNYSSLYDNGSSFKWMVEVSPSSNGSFSIPALLADINKINVYSQDFAPLKTSKVASELMSPPVIINLSQFKPGRINDTGQAPEIVMNMLKSNTACDVPYPPADCSLGGQAENMSNFNPFKRVVGGGKTSLRMTLLSNNITVHYKNVDMLASGPPDALFDSNALVIG